MTGGTNSGVMKLVGEARAKYNPEAPLIGICPLGAVEPGSRLRDAKKEDMVRGSFPYRNDSDQDTLSPLDPNHSHFIFVDNQMNGQKAFGCERGLRTHLESCVASSLDGGYPLYELHGFAERELLKYNGQQVVDAHILGASSALQAIKLLDKGVGVNGKRILHFPNNLPKWDLATGGDWFMSPLPICTPVSLTADLHRSGTSKESDGDAPYWCKIEPEDELTVCSALQAIWLHAGNGTFKERLAGWTDTLNGQRISPSQVAKNINEKIKFEKAHQELKIGGKTYAFGLTWRQVQRPRPTDGEEIASRELQQALMRKAESMQEGTCIITFTQKEWDALKVPSLRMNHFVASAGRYFQPARTYTHGDFNRAGRVQHEDSNTSTWRRRHLGRGDGFSSTFMVKASREKIKVHSLNHHNDVPIKELIDVYCLTKALSGRHFWEQVHEGQARVLLEVEKKLAEYFAGEDQKPKDFEKLKTIITKQLRQSFNLEPREASRLFNERVAQWRQGERDVIVTINEMSGPESSLPKKISFSCKLKNLKRMSADRVHDQLVKELRAHANGLGPDDQEPQEDSTDARRKIPLVSICLQGGPGSIDMALRVTQAGTPSLFVRGSGKAADLVSDAVLLRFTSVHPAFVMHRSALQQALWDFLVICGVRSDPNDEETRVYSWELAIDRIEQELIFLDRAGSLQGYADKVLEHSAILRDKAKALVTDKNPIGYEIQKKFEDDKDPTKKCLCILQQALQTGESELVVLCDTVLVIM